jgi:hyperosmotically inducible protein
MNKTSFAVLVLSSAISGSAVLAQSPATVSPDNAKSNKVDLSNATTADSQANNATDLDLTKRIRQSVMADKSLSTYAHNVKIVTVNGNVTLNGVVRSEDEKGVIGKKAVDVVGKDKVTNDLKIAPSNH